jgi:hypothetical protein
MRKQLKELIRPLRKYVYKMRGAKPWSYGYLDARWEIIETSIRDSSILQQFSSHSVPEGFGIGFDERVVEYPWIFSNLKTGNGQKILDAGSTFNYPQVISHPTLKNSELNIYTFYPEDINFIPNRVSYQFGDLRNLPYKNDLFDQVVCQSTIEHVDMDNSIYGYDLEKVKDITTKSYEFILVINELVRVLKPMGKLLLTFPYGKFDNYGFFQQFDAEMVGRITSIFTQYGTSKDTYIHYYKNGWKFVSAADCVNSTSHNPHTGQGKENDGAAHCRCVCCIEFIKA